MEKNISIDLSKDLCEKLYIAPWARKPMEAINKVSDRYFCFIEREKKKLAHIFSEKEFQFMCVACRDVDWSPAEKLYDGVLREISDLEDEYYLAIEVSKTQIEGKLRSLTVFQQFALVDLIEEYWFKNNTNIKLGLVGTANEEKLSVSFVSSSKQNV